MYFLTILPCSTFELQIKPARITLSSKNKIMIVIIPSQSMESKYVDFKTFFQHCKLTTFLHDYFDRKTYEQIIYLKFQIMTPNRTNDWGKCRDRMIVSTVSDVMFFIILAKNRWIVGSGIRTHAYKSRLRPERSALDRSAILTCAWPEAKSSVRNESYFGKLWTFNCPQIRSSILAGREALARARERLR